MRFDIWASKPFARLSTIRWISHTFNLSTRSHRFHNHSQNALGFEQPRPFNGLSSLRGIQSSLSFSSCSSSLPSFSPLFEMFKRRLKSFSLVERRSNEPSASICLCVCDGKALEPLDCAREEAQKPGSTSKGHPVQCLHVSTTRNPCAVEKWSKYERSFVDIYWFVKPALFASVHE